MTQSNKMIRPFFDKKKLNNIKKEMMTVDQIPGIQTIWEHGLSVASHYKILITNLRLIASGNRVENEIYIPEALIENAQEILNRITLPDRVMQKYLVFHDIGKPICAIKDEFGQMHFPDHEKISAQIYASIFPCEKEIISLIENDMIFHKLKSDEISNFCKTNNFIELLLAGIAALNSNSCLFGGRDSVNFKIKAKTVNQRIKVICRKLKEV